MSKLNFAQKHAQHTFPLRTHEGGPAARITDEQALRRAVGACMLFEANFYESGVEIADRIRALVPKTRPAFAAAVAYEARTRLNLRHAPLLVVREMARHEGHKALVGKLLPDVIQRADELSEFLAIYWKDGKQPLANQVRDGLRAAFANFDEFQLAKYDRSNAAIRLRDVAFMVRAKFPTKEGGNMLARLVNKSFFPEKTKVSQFPVKEFYGLGDKNPGLATPDTWETELSSGADKKATFERLMTEGKLGALAFLRNLRNMKEAGVDRDIIVAYASLVDLSRVLPFRYIAAARAVPAWENILEPMLLRTCESRERLPGRTVVLLDVSGSMDAKVSDKSDITRIDAACGLAMVLRELCEDIAVFTFSNALAHVAPRRGFALRDAIVSSQTHASTYLGMALDKINRDLTYDRIAVFTDEQSADKVNAPKGKGYMINVASHQNGVGYGPWMHIDGFSEAVIDFVIESERLAP